MFFGFIFVFFILAQIEKINCKCNTKYLQEVYENINETLLSFLVIMERHYGFEVRYVDVVSRGEQKNEIAGGHQARTMAPMMIFTSNR